MAEKGNARGQGSSTGGCRQRAHTTGKAAPFRHPFQVRGAHRRAHRGAHGGRRAVEHRPATAAGRERSAREGRGAGRPDACHVGLHRHQPEHRQPQRGRHVPHEDPRVRRGRKISEHAVHLADRLHHPLHQPDPAPGRQRRRRVRGARLRGLRIRSHAGGVLRRGDERGRPTGVPLPGTLVRHGNLPGMPWRPEGGTGPVRLREGGHARRRDRRRDVHHRAHGHLRARHADQRSSRCSWCCSCWRWPPSASMRP